MSAVHPINHVETTVKNGPGSAWTDGVGSSSDDGCDVVDDTQDSPSWRQRLWHFMDEPSSGRLARIYSLVMLLVIAASVVTFCLQTLPAYSRSDATVWRILEAAFISVFTTEYLVRLISCPNAVKFVFSVLNMIDLVAILPFYIELVLDKSGGGSNTAVLRVVRLVRVFRIFKMSKYASAIWLNVFISASRESARPLFMLAQVTMIGCVFFSSAMFFAERGDLNSSDMVYYRRRGLEFEVSPFQSIPGTFWWCMVTMTTVGYGDAYPITPLGKLIAVCTCITGVLVLAVPITVFSTNFNVEYDRVKKRKRIRQDRGKLLQNHFNEAASDDLGMMLGEIDFLTKQAGEDLATELGALIESASEELNVEIKELVRIAYNNRQRDIIRARASTLSVKSRTPR